MRRWRRSEGQAAVELVAVLPLLALLCAAVWEGVLAGHAVWAAGSAARAAARAVAVDGDPRAAARAALPASLERGLRVTSREDGEVRISLVVPSVGGPALRLGHLSATARFAPQGE